MKWRILDNLSVIVLDQFKCETQVWTYVLMMAEMKVPHGSLQFWLRGIA
jgi:hypothetical protein